MRFVLKLTETKTETEIKTKTGKKKDVFLQVIVTSSLYQKFSYAVMTENTSTPIDFSNRGSNNKKCGSIDYNEPQPSEFFGFRVQKQLERHYGENYSKQSYLMTWLPMNEETFIYMIVVKPIFRNSDKSDESFTFVRSFIENLY